MEKIRFFLPTLLFTLFIAASAHAQFECVGYIGTCKKSPLHHNVKEQNSCYETPVDMKNGKKS